MKLTKKDMERIRKHIDFRNGDYREKLLEDLKTARAQGDLSENFEYTMAKRKNNENNNRIRFLENLISTAQIIDPESRDKVAGIDKKITIAYLPDDDDTEELILVTDFRADSKKGLVSFESPLGKALMGIDPEDETKGASPHREGDELQYPVTTISSRTGREETNYFDIKIIKVEPADDAEAYPSMNADE